MSRAELRLNHEAQRYSIRVRAFQTHWRKYSNTVDLIIREAVEAKIKMGVIVNQSNVLWKNYHGMWLDGLAGRNKSLKTVRHIRGGFAVVDGSLLEC